MAIRLLPLPPDRVDSWRADVRERLRRIRDASGLRPGADAEREADAILAAFLPDDRPDGAAAVLSIEAVDGLIGDVWLHLPGPQALIVDLHVVRETSAAERDALMGAIEDLARARSATSLGVALFAGDRVLAGFLDGREYTVSSIQMVLDPLPARPAPDVRVEVRPMTEERFTLFVAESERHFATELAATGRMTKMDAVAEAHRQFAEELPDGLATSGQFLRTAYVDGEEVGLLWLALRERGSAPHAFILDIAVDARRRRRGHGRALMHAAEREAARLGARSLGLHVFGANTGAIALYEDLGYQRLEEFRIRLLS
ncbi:GNAT family N-acetyltransferase [Microbacterium tumbae]